MSPGTEYRPTWHYKHPARMLSLASSCLTAGQWKPHTLLPVHHWGLSLSPAKNHPGLFSPDLHDMGPMALYRIFMLSQGI